jgi:hypothetical protein
MSHTCAAEAEVASEFPKLYAFCSAHPARRPERPEIWERVLRVARNCRPILDELRARGLDLVQLDQYTPPNVDRQPLHEAVLNWLPKMEDPLTVTICLSRLTEPKAKGLVKKNRELMLDLARKWNAELGQDDEERTLAVLAQVVMRAVVARDVPEVLGWARDTKLHLEARMFYVSDLERFARKPGIARDELLRLVNDSELGSAAVWAIAGAMKADALPVLRELRASSPHDHVRQAAAIVARKLEARSGRVDLAPSSPSTLPPGYASTTIEFDTDRVPEFLSGVEREFRAQLPSGVAAQLALSADQLKRGQRRFHTTSLTFEDGGVSQIGVGLIAEDEDVVVLELQFDPKLRHGVDSVVGKF